MFTLCYKHLFAVCLCITYYILKVINKKKFLDSNYLKSQLPFPVASEYIFIFRRESTIGKNHNIALS